MSHSRIQQIVVHEVVVPAKAGAVNSSSLETGSDTPWYMLPICLAEFHIDDGIVALGEVVRGVKLADIASQLKELVGHPFGGVPADCLPQKHRAGFLWGLLESFPPPLWRSNTALMTALEMAALDWAGKKLSCRAVDLLGGAYRQTLAVDYWCGRQTPADLARIAAQARKLGFTGLKMKSCAGDPTAQQLRAIRDAAGEDFRVTIDPMFQWLNPHDALPMMRSVEGILPGLKLEDPFPQDQPDFWRRARQACGIPLIWHARGVDPLRRALQENCADGFNCSGGLFEFLTLAHAVEVMGYPCWHGSAIELGVGQAAHMHAAAAARSCILPNDFVGSIVRQHTLVNCPWTFEKGMLALPSGPGLGVELDRAAVKQFQTADATFG